MASLPYVTSPGNIDKAFRAIKAAAVPERVSQDFVKTILKIPGGSGDQMTSFLKKLGFASADGQPTELYSKFRNPTTSAAAVSTAFKQAYAPLYIRNEFLHELDDEELRGIIMEETGLAHDANPVRMTLATLKALKAHADFEAGDQAPRLPPEVASIEVSSQDGGRESSQEAPPQRNSSHSVGLRLGYTINLNLPATSDAAVFNAIFKSLKEHLLRDDDA